MIYQCVHTGRTEVSGLMLERVDLAHPLSGLRRLRELRAAGLVDYECISASKSRYRITSTEQQLVNALRSME